MNTARAPSGALIRHYRADDAPILSRLHVQSVTAIGCGAYSPTQVAAWAARAPSPERLQAMMADGRLRLVAVDGTDVAVAFADLEANGHIDLLYCAPEAVGRGVASALYDALEDWAIQHDLKRLWAEASEVARPFFERHGFTVTERRDLTLGEVAIHNYAMEKALTAASR